MKRKALTLSAATLALLVGVISVGTTAHANQSRHCWLDITSGSIQCFSTLQDSIDAVGSVGTSVQKSSGATSRAVVAATSVVIGIVFDDAEYMGDSLVISVANGCDSSPGADWSLNSMPTGWNDKISSFKSYANCATKIFEHINYGGATLPYTVNTKYVGDAMNDKTSSMRWN